MHSPIFVHLGFSYVAPGPAQQDFEWRGSNVSEFFFWGGGGGGGGGERRPWAKIRVLVTLRYRKVDLKLTNSVLKRNIFITGPQTKMVLTY